MITLWPTHITSFTRNERTLYSIEHNSIEISNLLATQDIEVITYIYNLNNKDTALLNNILFQLENNNYIADETLHKDYDYNTWTSSENYIMWTWEGCKRFTQ